MLLAVFALGDCQIVVYSCSLIFEDSECSPFVFGRMLLFFDIYCYDPGKCVCVFP